MGSEELRLAELEERLAHEKEISYTIKQFRTELSQRYGLGGLEEWIETHGLTYEQYKNSNMWRIVSGLFRELIGHCEQCGYKNDLQVHHITYKHLGLEIFYLEDLQLLCDGCHRKVHGIYRRQPYYHINDIIKYSFPQYVNPELRIHYEKVDVK